MNYGEYLQSPHWREVRAKRLEKDDYRCAICGSTKDLNVHHLSYHRIGDEDVSNDLVTLCHSCHATLHRVKELVSDTYKEIANLDGDLRNHYINALRWDVESLMCVEIWLRDKANGGDLNIWDSGGRIAGRLIRITRIAFPDLKPLCVCDSRIKDTLRLARAMRICKMYKDGNSITQVADAMCMRPPNVQRVLKRHGFNATAKIT